MTTIADLQEEAYSIATMKGWRNDKRHQAWLREIGLPVPPDDVVEPSPLECVALIHTELSEAVEAYRDGKMEPGERGWFGEELADAVLRILDLAAALGIDLEDEIVRKMAYNWTRPRRHGGKAA